jgi:hypothetical protein
MPKARPLKTRRTCVQHIIKREAVVPFWNQLISHKDGTLVLDGDLVISGKIGKNPVHLCSYHANSRSDDPAIEFWTKRFKVTVYADQ